MLNKKLVFIIILITAIFVNFSYAVGLQLTQLIGNCSKVIIKNLAFDNTLCNKMHINEYQNGGISFGFYVDKDEKPFLISFFGPQSEQIQKDKDNFIQPISKITYTIAPSHGVAKPEGLSATGSCLVSNPYKGKPAKISCSATTDQGSFVVEFMTNGDMPESKTIEIPNR